MKSPLVYLALCSMALASEKHMLTGIVRDALTAESLAAANVRVMGTPRGTITNVHGRYTLVLESGNHTLLVSILGYRPDTLSVRLSSNATLDVMLYPADITMPEVLVTSEDPALEIIRRAIANKRRWMDRMISYEMEAFTRQILRRDTSIASITESYTTGYWQQGDTLREVIRQRRQTANVDAAFNVASVGRILNFSEDEVRFLGYAFVGPTATDALDYYDYKLLRTYSSHGHELYEIKMIPRTKTVPLFEGTVNIANESYALVGVDVQPNDAFLIPFVKEKKLRYRQQFGLYDRIYWMPVDIRIDGAFTIGIIGLSFPKVVFSHTSVIYNYSINTQIPDSVFRKPRLVVDSSAARFDSTFWSANAVLPLSVQEEHAYQTIDSAQTLDVQFRPGGLAARFGTGVVGTMLSFADCSFNRVEGLHLGAMAELDSLSSIAIVRAGLAYGFADKLTKYNMGATLFTSSKRNYGIGVEVFRRVDHRPDQGYYGSFANSLTCLLDKNDYRDYYRADGWRVFVQVKPSSLLKFELSLTNESQKTLVRRTDFSLFYPSRTYRANPPITEGTLRSLRLDARLGQETVLLDFITRNGIDISIEHSTPSIAGSQFDFTRYSAVATLTVPTFGRSYLFRPMFRIRIAAGASSRTLPPQRYFDLESSLSVDGPFGVMRGMDVKEFSGTASLAMNVEHNFRSLPFLALGIPFLYENNLEFILHGGGARTWNQGSALINTTDGWYYEAGFGINRIF